MWTDEELIAGLRRELEPLRPPTDLLERLRGGAAAGAGAGRAQRARGRWSGLRPGGGVLALAASAVVVAVVAVLVLGGHQGPRSAAGHRPPVRGPITRLVTTMSPARHATRSEIAAFVALATRGSTLTYTLTYDTSIRYESGRTRHIAVTVVQRTPRLGLYRATPSIQLTSPNGPAASYSTEVFDATQRLGNARPGLYSCAWLRASSRPVCTGPYTDIGMGGTAAMLGPYPPRALLLGLQNAVETYIGVPSGLAIQPRRAFLYQRGSPAHRLTCLSFGPPVGGAGSVCLRANGVIASYDLPGSVTSSTYTTATLRSYSPRVAAGAFTLPAKPAPG